MLRPDIINAQDGARDVLPPRASMLRIAIGIATAGRATILDQMLTRLSAQTRSAEAVVVCVPDLEEVKGIADKHPLVTFISGPRGASHQRNSILRHLDGFDVVVFFDDDFVPCRAYVREVETFMLANPDVVMTTGHVIRDGVSGPGLSFAEADALLTVDLSTDEQAGGPTDISNGYGCNMSARLAPLRAHSVFFDENLPLYSWLEDVDFGFLLSRHGRIVKLPATRGVHLGTKSGRQSGLRLGYSQIANPIYLARKGTCSWARCFYLMSRNFTANVVRSFRPEPWIDRRGRLAGNVRAFVDLVCVRMEPGRVRLLK